MGLYTLHGDVEGETARTTVNFQSVPGIRCSKHKSPLGEGELVMYLKKRKKVKAVEETVRSLITCGLEEITMESWRGQQTSCTVPDNKYLRYHRPNSTVWEVTGIVLVQKENGPQLFIDGILNLVII